MTAAAHCHLESVTLDIPILRSAAKRHRQGGPWLAGMKRDAKSGAMVRVLDDVTLRLDAGARVGIVGPNGVGKSTLLRVAAGIYQPTQGRITRRGRVSTLRPIKPAKPDGTGYDSVLLQGALLGLGRAEVLSRVDEIAGFSELGDRLESPVNTYSDGMLARLTFAAFICFEPEIVLIDEWINTLDRQFLDKAQPAVEALSERGGILALASHQTDLLMRMCSTGAVLDKGRVQRIGPMRDVLRGA